MMCIQNFDWKPRRKKPSVTFRRRCEYNIRKTLKETDFEDVSSIEMLQ